MSMQPEIRIDPYRTEPPTHLRALLERGEVIAWEDEVVLPTYLPDTPSQLPMFLDQRVYQGSSGRVYPLPFIEGVARDSVDRAWRVVHLENAYLHVTVLPELGGRIATGFDKTTGYDFLYRNDVIKPALVGLTGPWISGGIEFNWPQHHRPATFLPVQWSIEEGDDGSRTVWCSDHDPFTRMAEAHGIRLHRDSTAIEIAVNLHNRTPLKQTFLWWANAAVRVHDDYQSFFPQDVHYVADHARRAITAFPAADRPYYGVDYPARGRECAGADRIDWYRNIPAPTSYMVVDTAESFFGGYDHAAGAGIVHWADRRISPGKKQWTWGNSPFGHAWDRHLSDDGGPYVELMAGVFTDNQPDFAWLMPGETKRFSQFWYPIPALGPAHAATPRGALHVEASDNGVAVACAVTAPTAVVLRVFAAGAIVAEEHRDLVPGEVLRVAASGSDVRVLAQDAAGEIIAEWRPATDPPVEPWVATAPASAEDIASVDELYLTGLHLQQYRHPTRRPETYWDEALRRDPGDARTNLALAETLLRRGSYAEARDHAARAIARLTARNERLRDTEPYYLMGLICERLRDDDAALDWFARAGWDGSWVAAAGVRAARIALRRGDFRAALADADALAASRPEDVALTAIRVVALRGLGDAEQADAVLANAVRAERGNVLLTFLAEGAVPDDAGLRLDLGLDLRDLGLTEDAVRLFEAAALVAPTSAGNPAPIARYVLAALLDDLGDVAGAAAARQLARDTDSRWCFPAGLDAHDALTRALAADPFDAVAADLLGMLLYDAHRRGEAVVLWREAADRSGDPRLHRNLALALFEVDHDTAGAWGHYVRAVEADPRDARLLFEWDQLAARLGHSVEERLDRLRPRVDVVETRDDLTVEYARLLTAAGEAAQALELLEGHEFQPWEGGEGRTLAAWDEARAALGLGLADPPLSLGEARPEATAPVAKHEDGSTDYFATSLPDVLLFTYDPRAESA